jgi:hypothetical protein
MRPRSLYFAAFVALTFWSAAHAAERKARLTIEIQVTGDEVWHGKGSDEANVKFSQHLALITYMRSDGEPMDSNPKDPDDAQGPPQSPSAAEQADPETNPKPPLKSEEEMQAYVEEQARACNGDTNCLMKLSDETANWGAQVNGEAPEAAEQPEDDASAGRFLQYSGFSKCGATIKVQVNDSTQGAYGDANGAVPFQVVARADYAGTNADRELLCTQTDVVVDQQKKTLFTDGLLVFDVQGEVIRTERGKTQTIKGDIPLKIEAFNWVSSQLREAPLSGRRQTTLTLRKPNGSNVPFSANAQGAAKIELTWRFEEL